MRAQLTPLVILGILLVGILLLAVVIRSRLTSTAFQPQIPLEVTAETQRALALLESCLSSTIQDTPALLLPLFFAADEAYQTEAGSLPLYFADGRVYFPSSASFVSQVTEAGIFERLASEVCLPTFPSSLLLAPKTPVVESTSFEEPLLVTYPVTFSKEDTLEVYEAPLTVPLPPSIIDLSKAVRQTTEEESARDSLCMVCLSRIAAQHGVDISAVPLEDNTFLFTIHSLEHPELQWAFAGKYPGASVPSQLKSSLQEALYA